MAIDEISSLVKFCSAETGLKVLNSQSLRWSAPHLFNDPFELNHHSEPDFTPETLLTGMIKEAINLLFGPSEPTGKHNRLITAISRWRGEERFASEEEAEQVLKQLLGQIVQQQQEGINSYLSAWQQFACSLRVCCFSDKPTNMQAWQRFADNHAGIALRFSAGEDTALPEPRKVTYGTTPPQVSSLKEQIAVTYGREKAPKSDGFIDKMLMKNKDNNVEREWRCFAADETDSGSDEQTWYNNKRFSAPELKAVYIGLATSLQNKEAVINLVKAKYANTKVYQAVALPNRYEIDFSQLATK